MNMELGGASTSRYTNIFEMAPVAFVTVDQVGRIVDANRSAEVLFGISRALLAGRLLSGMISSEDEDCLDLLLHRAAELHSKQHCELTVTPPNGEPTPVLIEASLDNAQSYLCMLTDLREVRSRERELRALRARESALLEATGEGLVILDPTGAIESINEAGAALLGRPREQLVGRSVEAVSDRDPPVHVEVEPIGEGASLGYVGVLRTTAEDQQNQKMEAIGALASGIAHDFNNLLMGVAGFATIALSRLESAHPAFALVKRIVDVAGRGRTLTRHLLDFSRRRQPERGALDVDLLLTDCVPLLETLLGERITLVVRPGATGCRVCADAGELEQVLLNLASNAADAMTKGGTLRITTEERIVRSEDLGLLPAGRYLVLSVRDTGFGMDEATRTRVFERFFTTKDAGKGTGLGLWNTQVIVKRMGGAIDVSSAVGVGTTFTIHLPVVQETGEIPRPALPIPRRTTVLAVEDDPLVRLTVGFYLESLGYRTLMAADGADARRIFQEHVAEIEIVLTDIMLPHELGRDLAAEIRRQNPNIRIAYMSAHERESLLERDWIDLGAPLLQKPFEQERLAAVLRKLLES